MLLCLCQHVSSCSSSMVSLIPLRLCGLSEPLHDDKTQLLGSEPQERGQGGVSSPPARALKMYLVPGVSLSAVTVSVPCTGWMVCQPPPPRWSFISSSHTHWLGSCNSTQRQPELPLQSLRSCTKRTQTLVAIINLVPWLELQEGMPSLGLHADARHHVIF